MTQYKTKGDAYKALTNSKNKLKYTRTKQERESRAKVTLKYQDYADGYATICEFLSHETKFMDNLKIISAKLWAAYIRDPSRSNKFTRALSMVGQQYGFKVHNMLQATEDTSLPMRFKLAGADKGLGWLLRNNLFWKDSMNAFHGEHTHSLQWLAIAEEGLTLKVPLTDLYAKSANWSLAKTPDKDGDRCLAWQWVADCFPTERKKLGEATKILETNHNLHSDSFRSPQFIMKKVLPLSGPIEGHFVSHYLDRRYKKRGWGKTLEGKIDVTDGGDSKVYALDEKKMENWNKSTSPLSKDARLIRKTEVDPRIGENPSKPLKEGKYEVFHGVPGMLYMNE